MRTKEYTILSIEYVLFYIYNCELHDMSVYECKNHVLFKHLHKTCTDALYTKHLSCPKLICTVFECFILNIGRIAFYFYFA